MHLALKNNLAREVNSEARRLLGGGCGGRWGGGRGWDGGRGWGCKQQVVETSFSSIQELQHFSPVPLVAGMAQMGDI